MVPWRLGSMGQASPGRMLWWSVCSGSWWLRLQPLLILTASPDDCDLHISFITKRIVLQSYRLPSLYRRHIFLHPPLSLHVTKCPLYGGILVKLSHVANGLGSTLCNLQSYLPLLRTWSVYFYNWCNSKMPIPWFYQKFRHVCGLSNCGCMNFTFENQW